MSWKRKAESTYAGICASVPEGPGTAVAGRLDLYGSSRPPAPNQPLNLQSNRGTKHFIWQSRKPTKCVLPAHIDNVRHCPLVLKHSSSGLDLRQGVQSLLSVESFLGWRPLERSRRVAANLRGQPKEEKSRPYNSSEGFAVSVSACDRSLSGRSDNTHTA
jgi:hypothetical protein